METKKSWRILSTEYYIQRKTLVIYSIAVTQMESLLVNNIPVTQRCKTRAEILIEKRTEGIGSKTSIRCEHERQNHIRNSKVLNAL